MDQEWKETLELTMVLNAIFVGYLAVLGLVDIKKIVIDIRLLLAGFVPAALLAAVSTSMTEAVGGILIGAVFLVIAVLTKEQIGKADGLVICQTGLAAGFGGCIFVIGVAFIIVLPCVIFLMIFRKAGRKTRIPFLPFIFSGFLVYAIMGLIGK